MSWLRIVSVAGCCVYGLYMGGKLWTRRETKAVLFDTQDGVQNPETRDSFFIISATISFSRRTSLHGGTQNIKHAIHRNKTQNSA